MKRLFLVVLLLTLAGTVFAQQRWERNYGGEWYERGYSVKQTQDGGYIITGANSSIFDSSQVYLIKTNASGDSLWSRSYGGAPNEDQGASVQQTTDGGYIIAGYTGSFGAGGRDVYLIKTNAFGDTLWTKAFGGPSSDYGRDVKQTTDGGYIVVGWTASFGNQYQVYLIKTNPTGDTLWTRTYGVTIYDYGASVQQTQDGGYIVAGTSSIGTKYRVNLLKTNASGVLLWSKSYEWPGDSEGYSVQQTQDGGYIVAGRAGVSTTDVLLMKANASGDSLWTRNYGGTSTDFGYSVQQTSDGGFIVAGETFSFGNDYQVYLVKTNAVGDTIWTKTFGGADEDRGRSVRQTSDGGYIVAGFTYSFGNRWQVYLIKTDSQGRSSGVEETRNAEFVMRNAELRITPNPFTTFATLPGHEAERFSLYGVSGRKVGSYRGDRVGEGLAPGVYFLRQEGKNAEPLRIVKIR